MATGSWAVTPTRVPSSDTAAPWTLARICREPVAPLPVSFASQDGASVRKTDGSALRRGGGFVAPASAPALFSSGDFRVACYFAPARLSFAQVRFVPPP